jgi:hypothetical protein
LWRMKVGKTRAGGKEACVGVVEGLWKKKPRKKQGHLPADGVPAATNPRRNSIFLLLWYHECLPGRHNYLLGDFILFQTVRFRHNLSDRREKRGRTVCSVLGAVVDSSWNVMAHGDAREGKGRGNWRMEWVASTLPLPRNMVYPALLPLMRTPWLPVVDWTDAPADLNGLVRFAEKRNLVSVRVPSHFNWPLPLQPLPLQPYSASDVDHLEEQIYDFTA